jgi:hypothetical protein
LTGFDLEYEVIKSCSGHSLKSSKILTGNNSKVVQMNVFGLRASA